ncbi:uncharacterized protein EKO05_0007675 [Ascochyta rabiei]|uniref:Uncharacterized protein n=1 Tax=Didymella rabiei TaxID=5454 RepID=A0A162VII2_DIDRA|nr:uncharacterized protein EKO05_0007675 [Ascochyta rabiei]KZM18478.1 hypothetical protein ST47_g10366 [Ascochyta rabiei]UPX17310.1 hypothetical protein EKO05_0007675 [Ascochyta rabiei]
MEPHIVDLGDSDVDTDGESETTEESQETDDSRTDDEEEFKHQLQDCLDEVEHEGNYSAVQRHKQYINPGLYIKDFGTIGLPLSTRDAIAITGKCRKAPFGKGDETVINEAVRRTWELDATDYGFGNPDWQPFLETRVQQTIRDLGVQVSAHAQPYKLLLYEEGAHFKAHRDTEKVPGMFGTLVVCLPSLHAGGSVHLSHKNKQQEMDTASASAFDLQILAWYSDVQHEIRPVEKGYRLVLTYNLVQDQSLPMQTAAALDARHDRLSTLLQTWNKEYSHLDYLVYPLEHKYSEASLSLRNLKGQDAARGQYLDNICTRNGFYWLLTRMTKELQDEDDYYSNDEDEEGIITFGKTMLPSGRYVYIGVNQVDGTKILTEEKVLYDRDPDSEEEGEYTGNESAPSILRYHDSVIILMTKRQMLDSFRRSDRHSAEALMALYDMVREDHACEPKLRHEAFILIMQKALMRVMSQGDDRRSGTYGYLVYGLEERERTLGEYAMVFETIADYCREQNLSSIFTGLLRSAVQEARWTCSNHLIKLIANQIVWETRTGNNNAWDDWFSQRAQAAPTYRYANELRQALEGFSKVLPFDGAVAFHQWRTAHLEDTVRNVQSASLDDAQSVLDLIPHISRETYFETITRVFANNVERQSLSRFMHCLADDHTISEDDIVKPSYQLLASTATTTLKLSATDITEPEPPRVFAQLVQYTGRINEIGTCAVEWLNIVGQYSWLGLESEAKQLLGACLPDLSTVTETWSKWKHWFLFVDNLKDLLVEHRGQKLHDICKAFITDVLHSCAKHIAQTRPQPPRNWVRTTNGIDKDCTCTACADLNAFLTNPKERIGRFSYAERTRKHLRYRLSNDFHIDTEKRKSPYTLVVTKTNKTHEGLEEEWQAQLRAMRIQLQTMKGSLEGIGINAEEAADLDAQLAGAGAAKGVASTARGLQPSPASRQNLAAPRRVAGAKRKSDFVDLTED